MATVTPISKHASVSALVAGVICAIAGMLWGILCVSAVGYACYQALIWMHRHGY